MTSNTEQSIDLGPDTPVYGTEGTEIGIDEDGCGYIQITTAEEVSYTFSVGKAAVEGFVEKVAAETDPRPGLEPPEDAPTDIESPHGWDAALRHTGGGIWNIIFRKIFDGNRVDVTIDAGNPDGVAVGGYRGGTWLGEITHTELDDPGYETALQTARYLIEQIEAGEFEEEIEEVFG